MVSISMADILVVDDNRANREALASLLEVAGHDVRRAASAREALESALADPPDLVVSDVLMPGMDGYVLVRELRADSRTAALPVVFYTAYFAGQDAQDLAQAHGVARVLLKPSDNDLILRTVKEVLAERTPKPAAGGSELGGEHLRIVVDQLLEKTGARAGARPCSPGPVASRSSAAASASPRSASRTTSAWCRAARAAATRASSSSRSRSRPPSATTSRPRSPLAANRRCGAGSARTPCCRSCSRARRRARSSSTRGRRTCSTKRKCASCTSSPATSPSRCTTSRRKRGWITSHTTTRSPTSRTGACSSTGSARR